MFKIDRIIDQQTLIVRWQQRVILLLVSTCLFLGWGWLQASKQITLYLPPDLSHGVTQKAGHIPKPFLYSFAFELWQEIYYWPEAKPNDKGDFPYKQNIYRYSAYLTPHFRDTLLKDCAALRKADDLARTRALQSALSTDIESHVKQLSAHSWEVDIDADVIERTGSMLLKHTLIRYPLRVIRYDVSRSANLYGLALAGFVRPPERLTDKKMLSAKD